MKINQIKWCVVVTFFVKSCILFYLYNYLLNVHDMKLEHYIQNVMIIRDLVLVLNVYWLGVMSKHIDSETPCILSFYIDMVQER